MAREKLSHTWRHIQSFLFPMIWDELGELTAKQKLLISVLETIKLEEYFPYISRAPGRPLEDRTTIARAFVTKMAYNMATPRVFCWIVWNPTRRSGGFADGSARKMYRANPPSHAPMPSLPRAACPNGCIRRSLSNTLESRSSVTSPVTPQPSLRVKNRKRKRSR